MTHSTERPGVDAAVHFAKGIIERGRTVTISCVCGQEFTALTTPHARGKLAEHIIEATGASGRQP